MAIQIAMVMVDGDSSVTKEEVASAFARLRPDAPVPSELEGDASVFSFAIGGENVYFGHMPAPIPFGDLEGPCATSRFWKNAEAEVKRHTAHWIVTVQSESAPVAASSLLMVASAALLDACPAAIGVYWCNATLVVPRAIFHDFAVEVLPHELPIDMWIDFRVGPDGEGARGFTHGLAALGLMEIESEGALESPSALFERMQMLSRYLLENGPVIKNGDTIGRDANERIRVEHAPSTLEREGNVMRLVYEPARKKRGWWPF